MKLLVSGGAGYIGSTTVEALLEAGHEVTVFDSLLKGHRAAVPDGARLVVGDLEDREALAEAFRQERYDGVLHFAALIEAGESMKEPGRYFRVNTGYAVNLLEAMVEAGVDRFVFSSTAAVYGIPDESPISEDAPKSPVNAYGESKLLVERMLDWFARIHGLRVGRLRYFNAAGARSADHGEDHEPETHLIPLILQVALGFREQIKIFGSNYPTNDGTCVRDYVHVRDLASAHVLAIEALSERDGFAYNLGTGRGYSIREVIEACRRTTGHPIAAEEADRRPGDPPTLVASSEAIRRDLGWEPRRSDLDEIVRTAWAWHQNHPNGYGDR